MLAAFTYRAASLGELAFYRLRLAAAAVLLGDGDLVETLTVLNSRIGDIAGDIATIDALTFSADPTQAECQNLRNAVSALGDTLTIALQQSADGFTAVRHRLLSIEAKLRLF